MAGRLVTLVGKAVRRSVWPLQVDDSEPMDPRELHLVLWIKPTLINGVRCLLGVPPSFSHGSMMWQGYGASGNVTWRWPTWPCGPKPLCHVHLPPMHLFCTFL